MNDEPATRRDIENVIGLIQQLSERMDQRFEAVEKRFGYIESRLDRISDTLVYFQSQMGALTRRADRTDRN